MNLIVANVGLPLPLEGVIGLRPQLPEVHFQHKLVAQYVVAVGDKAVLLVQDDPSLLPRGVLAG